MNINSVLDELKKKYPGKKIILNDKHNLTEILCEIDPTEKHSHYSIAVSVIDKTTPHFHGKTKETYEVIRGELDLKIGDQTIHLREGESYIIDLGNIHTATGNETWVKVTSRPGWTPQDYLKQ